MNELNDLLLLRAFFEPSVLASVASQVKADHFLEPSRKLIASTVCSMYEAGEAITPDTVVLRLIAAAGDTKDEASARIAQVMTETAPKAEEIGSILKSSKMMLQKEAQREFAEWMVQDAGKATQEQIRSRFEECSYGITDDKIEVHAFGEGLIRMVNDPIRPKVHTLGFGKLDLKYRIYPHSFNVVMADSGRGKTAFALNAALNLAMQGVTAFIHSIEMDRDSCISRLGGMACNVPCFDIDEHRLTDIQKEHILYVERENRAVFDRIKVMAPDGLMAEDTEARIAWLTDEYGYGVHLIDYLQSMDTAGGKLMTTTDNQTAASKILTRVAKKTGIPIIGLSQVTAGKMGMEQIAGSKQSKKDAWTILELTRDPDEPDDATEVALTAKLIKGRKNGVMMQGVPLKYDLITQKIFYTDEAV